MGATTINANNVWEDKVKLWTFINVNNKNEKTVNEVMRKLRKCFLVLNKRVSTLFHVNLLIRGY